MNFRGMAVALLVASVAAGAALPARAARPAHAAPPRARVRPFHSQILEQTRRIDVNNLNMFVTNQGAIAYDLAGLYNGGLFYPNHTSKTAVYAAGLWLGAKVRDTVRVAVAEYTQEFEPGRIKPDHMPEDPGAVDPNLRVYKVVRWSGNPSDTAQVTNPNADVNVGEDPLVHDSWADYVQNAKPYGAPTRMWTFTRPSLPDTLIEGPDVIGDEFLWSVYNDADPATHTNEAGSTAPLGVQIEQSTFAFDRLGPLGNTIFVKYKITNAGVDTLQQMYISQWMDPDLGNFTDDLVGCDTLPDFNGKPRSMGYVYNGTNFDNIYGTPPPSLGVDFLLGPIVAGDTLGLTSFARYINGTDPIAGIESYNYMAGALTDQNGDPQPIVDPFGDTTSFMVAGDPQAIGGTNWVDSNPADRRMFLSTGPITMKPGDTQTVIVGIVVGQCGTNLKSISALQFGDDAAQEAFNLGFQIPIPPASPTVTASTDHGSVTLDWNNAPELATYPAGYQFEGYNVYQGETIAGPWHLVAPFDSTDGIRTVYDKSFDNSNCVALPSAPVAQGQDNGIRHTFTTTQDAVRGTSIKDGTDYYFAVTAYIVNPNALADRVQESSLKAVHVVAQRPDSAIGTRSSMIRAVPNPYYAHSAYEQNQFARQLRFTNMPATCTLRIYNLAGQLVRTIQKNDPSSSILVWNLLTDGGLPVGSGVYIYHVQVPGGTDAVGRVVVFMEKERLNNF